MHSYHEALEELEFKLVNGSTRRVLFTAMTADIARSAWHHDVAKTQAACASKETIELAAITELVRWFHGTQLKRYQSRPCT